MKVEMWVGELGMFVRDIMRHYGAGRSHLRRTDGRTVEVSYV